MKKNRNQDGSFQKKNGHFSPRQITLRDGHFCQKRCHLGTILAWVPLCHISKISVSFSNRKWCQDGTFSEKKGHPQMEDRGGRGPEERGGRGPGANEVPHRRAKHETGYETLRSQDGTFCQKMWRHRFSDHYVTFSPFGGVKMLVDFYMGISPWAIFLVFFSRKSEKVPKWDSNFN